jgi:hypothetical protein
MGAAATEGVAEGSDVGGAGGPIAVGAGAGVAVEAGADVSAEAGAEVNVGHGVQVGGQVAVGRTDVRTNSGPTKLRIMLAATTAEST